MPEEEIFPENVVDKGLMLYFPYIELITLYHTLTVYL